MVDYEQPLLGLLIFELETQIFSQMFHVKVVVSHLLQVNCMWFVYMFHFHRWDHKAPKESNGLHSDVI